MWSGSSRCSSTFTRNSRRWCETAAPAGSTKADADLFTGAFWSGRRAIELGLIDGLGNMHQILRERYGAELVLKLMERSQAAWWRRFNPFGGAPLEAVVEAVETRILMSRFGL